MSTVSNRFLAAIAAVFIVIGTAIPVVTVPADMPAHAMAIAPVLA